MVPDCESVRDRLQYALHHLKLVDRLRKERRLPKPIVRFHSEAISFFSKDGLCLRAEKYGLAVSQDGSLRVSRQENPVHDVSETSALGRVAFWDGHSAIIYGCEMLQEDGSCVQAEERLTVWSRLRPPISSLGLSSTILDRVRLLCVDPDRLQLKTGDFDC